MTSDIALQPSPAPFAAPWPPDDTPESIVGTDRHQNAIIDFYRGLNQLAEALHDADLARPLPWQAIQQLLFLGARRRDGSSLTTYPDVVVLGHAIDDLQGSFRYDVDGPPLLVIEVLSPATGASDRDVTGGKGDVYARAGVREYLLVDVEGSILPQGMQGWRLENGRYAPWPPETDGRWHSREIAAVLGFDGPHPSVWSREGRRMQRGREVEREQRLHAAELARQQEEIERQREEAVRQGEEAARERALRIAAEAEVERQQAEVERLRRLLDARTDPGALE